jgi:Holliday junction resolvase RusA-like endonuclease
MPLIKFFVEGTPMGQPRGRHRAFQKGTFVPREHGIHAWRDAIGWAAKDARIGLGARLPIEGGVSCRLHFFFPRPNSHFMPIGKKFPTPRLRIDAPTFHIVKPDRDNCEKAVLDALKKSGFWNDDCQVCCGEVIKCYGEREGVLIEIDPL